MCPLPHHHHHHHYHYHHHQVIVNLYPFRATVTRSPPPPFEDGVENIDIGGPAMIRAAAKNHGDVTVIVDPADYSELLAQLSSGAGGVSEEFRKKMAWKAYQHTASYDAQVCGWVWVGGAGLDNGGWPNAATALAAGGYDDGI